MSQDWGFRRFQLLRSRSKELETWNREEIPFPSRIVPVVFPVEEAPKIALSNIYQHDRVSMVFKKLCILGLGNEITSALEGVTEKPDRKIHMTAGV